MNKRLSFEEVIAVWSTEHATREHILPEELYAFLLEPPDHRRQAEILPHLLQCAVCQQELEEMAQCQEEVEVHDIVLPAAAATDAQWPEVVLTAAGGKYTIEIRRDLFQPNQGVMTVKVAEAHRADMEGKSIRVTNGEHHDHVLLQGQITNGEVSQMIEGLDHLDLRFWIDPAE